MSRIGDSRRVHDDEPRFGLIRQLPEEVTEPTSMNRTCFRSAESAEAQVRAITGIRADGSQILSCRIQLVEQRMNHELVSGHVFRGDIGSTSLVRQLASDMYIYFSELRLPSELLGHPEHRTIYVLEHRCRILYVARGTGWLLLDHLKAVLLNKSYHFVV